LQNGYCILFKAPKIAFVSNSQKSILELKLLNKKTEKSLVLLMKLFYNGFNANFEIIRRSGEGSFKYNVNLLKPYIFHVGHL
jgi:hypothetical protein